MPASKQRKQRASAAPKRRGAAAECMALFASLSGCVEESLPQKICADVARHLDECTACAEFLESLHDTVQRMHKAPPGKRPPQVAGHLRRTILEEYRATMKMAGKSHGAGR